MKIDTSCLGKALLALMVLIASPVSANEVSIENVRVECPNTCTFAVTLKHEDAGWSHYADQWDVMTLDGKLLKSRVLFHPHVEEQPFTRSLSGVAVPEGTKAVLIRAKDSKHGYSKQTYRVELP